MWHRWLPWRYFATRVAKAYGFPDPVPWLRRMRKFAHPSEVSEPVELLRAGVLFHARGLINTKAIQHNLDWIWPYWVERQFNPADAAFVPRAFSFSHINLTHRNWTAVGLPDLPHYPIVDPRGLVTPFFDGWSLDCWLVGPTGQWLIPSKLAQAEQRMVVDDGLRIESKFIMNKVGLATTVAVEQRNGAAVCAIQIEADAQPGMRLAVAVRPYNPEGISFIDSIRPDADGRALRINDVGRVEFNRMPERCFFSTYRQGDVAHAIFHDDDATEAQCPVSLATAAAVFCIRDTQSVEVSVPLVQESRGHPVAVEATPPWKALLAACAHLEAPDTRVVEIYRNALAALILHTPGEVYPGPYTYKRFWYRDAAYILHALAVVGAHQRVRRALDLFPRHQTAGGYFRSQDGEWDSNGEALWIMERHLQLSGESMPKEWQPVIEKGARWIVRKRLPRNASEPHAGLLPAGFSAEHLGPNDYYYWDNFWGVAGLRVAARLLEAPAPETAMHFAAVAGEYWQAIQDSFRHIPDRLRRGAISASPHRRLDAGAIGSIVADYPLQLFPPGETRLRKTVEFLLEHSMFDGGFFQNMIHSGINIYLTLQLAQVLLRNGDRRAFDLMDTVVSLASPTGQWPEAIHPRTRGGCMGDGQHTWAAAEWVLFVRNCFVREESEQLILGSGLLPRWLKQRQPLCFGPSATSFGPVSVRIEPANRADFRLRLDAQWRSAVPGLVLRVPGYERVTLENPSSYLLHPSS